MSVVTLATSQERGEQIAKDVITKWERETIDDLTEILRGLEGRIAAMDLVGLAVFGLSRSGDEDVLIVSKEVSKQKLKTIGALEMLKAGVISNEIGDFEPISQDEN